MTLVLSGCGAKGSSSSALPAAGSARVRFVEGAPSLETLVNGVPTDIGDAYLTVNGATVATAFPYGAATPFISFPGGTLSLEALDSLGYSVGPVKTSATLAAGQSYTVALVGSYPDYQALTFEEPAGNDNASLAVYAASPAFASADFGRFNAAKHASFQKLGSVRFGNVASVSLSKSVDNFGGYVGTGTQPIANGALTVAGVDAFDTRSALPFHNASRLSLFLFDPKPGSFDGPVFGSLDR